MLPPDEQSSEDVSVERLMSAEPVGGLQGRLDADENYIDGRSAGQELFRKECYRRGGAILIEGISSALYTQGESDSPAEGVMEKEPKGKRRRGKTK
jgi:hypothetical protein